VLLNPIETIGKFGIPEEVFYVNLDSVFYDPDSDIQLKLVHIDNQELLYAQIVKGGKPGLKEQTLLAVNVTPNMIGEAEVTISASSNGKTVYHTFKVILTVPVETKDITLTKIDIYPNPIIDVVNIETFSRIKSLKLFDIRGNVVFQHENINQNMARMTNLDNLPAGIYMLLVSTDNGEIHRKIVK
jgi:hypothetical protein